MKQLKVNIHSHSVAGIKDENQDACDCHIPSGKTLEYKGIVAVIADGVSACTRAKEASSCCVRGFLSDYYSTPDSWTVEHAANKVISALNNWLYSQSMRSNEVSSMLSTLTVLVIKSNTAHLFHVGDSRVYRYRNTVLEQLTQDHSLMLNQEKTYLSRAMGFDLRVSVDYQTFNLEQDDVFLLSTDGVHDYLHNKELANFIHQHASVDEIVESALTQGSVDNVSALLLRVDALPEKNLSEAFDELTQKPVPPDLEKGMKINGFEIESLIASSAKMQLYLAKDSQTEQTVALKTPSVNFKDDAQYLKHFSYEEWVGQRVQSPNVVKIHHSQQQVKFLAYAMTYIKGQTVRQWMNDNKNPDIKIVLSFVKQIIQGLRAFHRQEMLHCDIKPENIMIDEIGQIKLIDFGSTRIAGVAELLDPINIVGNQGTQGYTAPEVILDAHVSQASEQFSLGVIVYEIFTAKLPYQDQLNKQLTSKKKAKLQYQSALLHNPHLPVWIDGAIAKACHLDSEQRYQTLSEFLFDLEHPNVKFINPPKPRQQSSTLQRYKWLSALLFTLNLILLLLLETFT